MKLNGRFAIGVPGVAIQRIAAGVAAAMPLSIVSRVSCVASQLCCKSVVLQVARSHQDLFALGESLKPQRQYRAEPGRVCGVIGQIVASLGMQQHDQIIAIEH